MYHISCFAYVNNHMPIHSPKNSINRRYLIHRQLNMQSVMLQHTLIFIFSAKKNYPKSYRKVQEHRKQCICIKILSMKNFASISLPGIWQEVLSESDFYCAHTCIWIVLKLVNNCRPTIFLLERKKKEFITKFHNGSFY